jgi:hypothetical protein
MQRIILLILGIFPLFAGCAREPILPQSFRAEVLEIVDPSRVKILATGVGEEFEWAVHDAQKAAMARVIGDLVQSQEEKARFEMEKERIYKNYRRYVEGWELKSRRRTEEGDIEVQGVVLLNRRLIEDDLVQVGVIKERRERLELLEFPTIALLPETTTRGAGFATFAQNHGASYLTQRKYDVIDIEQLKKVEEMAEGLKEVEGLPSDPKAVIALQAGADIYIAFEIRLDEGQVGQDRTVKASASVRAFETTTARQIGAASGFSREYPLTAGAREKAVAEALGDALDRVLTNIEDYWKDDLKRGHQFLLTIRAPLKRNPELRRSLVEAIRSVAKSFKEELVTDQTMNYRVWYPGSNTDFLFALQDAVKARTRKELKEITTSRKLFVLKLD